MENNYKKDDLPTNPKEWKKWKDDRKSHKRKWNETKLLKELEKSQEKKIKVEEENSNTTGKNGRLYTVSIALPGSILDNAQSPELRTYLAGQIARAAVVFNVDEIIIFDETGTTAKSTEGTYDGVGKHGNANVQLGRILQYLECPQYLRKSFFPKHKDLQYAGILNPLDSPHHVRIDNTDATYREGVVLNVPIKGNQGSLVDVGLYKSCKIDKKIQPGVRVTVEMKPELESKKKHRGIAVSPVSPRENSGVYWGYNVRLASSLGAIFIQSPYKNGYDVTVGTSERGDNVDQYNLPSFKHLLVVFGGVQGLEASLDADNDLKQEDPKDLFDLYLNMCPHQGSNTIRTEEAILVSMSILRPQIQKNTLQDT